MKRKLTKVVALVCALTCVGSTLVACQQGKPVTDVTKTALYVGNYDGGFGHEWLELYEKGFEELYKDTSFENGKTGVDVVLLNDKVSYMASNLLATLDQSNIDIIFTEEPAYYSFVDPVDGDSLLYDMTSWVKETLPGESKSIETKLNQQQIDYYTSYDGKYYGLPHFQSMRGLIYDVDLFNQKSLFIKADGSISGKSTDTDLATGPDGQKGTYDDGMPATYDELWRWCEYVSSDAIGVTPFCWTGAYMDAYSQYLENALLVDTLGREAGQYFFSPSDAEVTVDLIRSFDSNGNPVITSETISRSNSYDMAYAAAGYYMLDFWKHILENGWYYNMSLNGLMTHDGIHYDYLRSNLDDEDDLKPIAFMIEGSWWENESDYIFKELETAYPNKKAARTERTFGYMPLPKARQEYVGRNMTLLDANNAIMFANANIKGKPEEEVAKKFVQYISTDANIQSFMTMTGIPRDYNVGMKTEQLEKLSPFSQQLWQIRENAEGIVYARKNTYQDERYILLNGGTVSFREMLAADETTWHSMPVVVFSTAATKDITSREFFEGVIRQYH